MFPLSSAPHSSREAASQGSGAACGQTVSGPRSAKREAGSAVNSRTVPACGESTPLGRPVLPEVKKTQQASVSRTGTGGRGWAPAAASSMSVPGTHTGTGGVSWCPGAAAISGASARLVSSAIRGAGQRGSRAA
ncbi:hypothetical protein SRIMM317S_03103 [Streptomyces rimosus subsp. rimosus]